jgi:glutamine synthetase
MPHSGRRCQSLPSARRFARLRTGRRREKIEPPEAFVGDIYQASNLPRVPHTLAQATDLFEKSEFAKRAFGPAVHEHYTHFYRTETQAYDKAVTDWERRRYFERI